MIRKPITERARSMFWVMSVLCAIGGYSYLSYRQERLNPNDTSMPTWTELYHGVEKITQVHPREGVRWIVVDAAATAQRLAIGILVGVTGAFLLGILMGCFKSFEAFWIPPLSFAAQVPPTAALAVFFVLFGVEQQMFVAMIAFGVLPTLAQVVYLGVQEVHDDLINKAYTLGASHGEVIWNVIVNMILPKLVDAVRLQVGPALVYLIAAEMVCAHVGMGYRIRLEFKLVHMDVVFPYLVTLATFGYLVNFTFTRLRRRLFPWYQEGR